MKIVKKISNSKKYEIGNNSEIEELYNELIVVGILKISWKSIFSKYNLVSRNHVWKQRELKLGGYQDENQEVRDSENGGWINENVCM